jgi:DNA-directed RNA polymerase specialized sigma24 family protein
MATCGCDNDVSLRERIEAILMSDFERDILEERIDREIFVQEVTMEVRRSADVFGDDDLRIRRMVVGLLCDRYAGRLFGFLYNKGFKVDDALDVVQQTALQAVAYAGSYDPARCGKLCRIWIFRIAANVAKDESRRKGKAEFLDEKALDSAGSGCGAAFPSDLEAGEERLFDDEVKRAIMEMVIDMEESKRKVFLLRMTGKGFGDISREVFGSGNPSRSFYHFKLVIQDLKEGLGKRDM